MAEGERPLLLPFLALSSGLVLADRYGLSLTAPAVGALFLALLLSCLVRARLVAGIGVFSFFLGWGLFVLPFWSVSPADDASILRYEGQGALIAEGIIRSRPVVVASEGGTYTRFILDATGVIRDGLFEPAGGRVMVYLRSGEMEQGRGDLVRLLLRISRPRRLGLPGEFDFPRFLALQGIIATGNVARGDELVLMRGGMGEPLMAWIDRRARYLGDFIRQTLPDPRVSSVVTALLIGDQRRIPEDLSRAYTRAGVRHILSISGFHVGILALFVGQTLFFLACRFTWPALRFNLRRGALLSSLPVMLVYLLLTGAAPATTRSVVMLALVVIALYLEREIDPLNALLVAALLLVALDPPSLFQLSFQLSFLALWGMLLVVPPVMERFASIRPAWLRALLRFAAVSCAASAATVVPLLYLFGQASLSGVLSNFLIVPLLGYGAVVSGFCSLLFVPLCPPLARLLLWCTGKLVILSNYLIIQCARLPQVSFGGITPLDLLAFLLFMGLASFLRPSRVRTSLCALIPLVAVMAHLAAPSAGDGRLHLTMLSVGQGESLLVRFPRGETMLVDGGGYPDGTGPDFGERLLGPALSRLGVRRIDYMVMTHAHPDHIGGFPFLVRTLPVGHFWEALPGGRGEEYAELRAALASRGTPVRRLAAGDILHLPGGTVMEVLSPRRAPPEAGRLREEQGVNERSLVFRLRYGDSSFLCTGDAGFPTEQLLLEQGVDLASEVLKVGHHGSRYSTSTEFLQRVSPRLALISVGSRNVFGLPSPRTLSRLRRQGIVIFRTDQDGTLELVSDGRELKVSTPWRPY